MFYIRLVYCDATSCLVAVLDNRGGEVKEGLTISLSQGSPGNHNGVPPDHVRSCDEESEEEKQLSVVDSTIR